jgi:hypothetical protein
MEAYAIMYKYMHSTVTEINYITFPKKLVVNCYLNIIHAREFHFLTGLNTFSIFLNQ